MKELEKTRHMVQDTFPKGLIYFVFCGINVSYSTGESRPNVNS